MPLARVLLTCVLGAWSLSIAAFPMHVRTQISVYPWVPTAAERVVITITDTLYGMLPAGPGGPVLANVSSTIVGNQIAIVGTLVHSPTAFSFVSFPVDLGVLKPGRYTVSYTNDTPSNASLHDASLTFSVADGLATAVEFFNAGLGHYFITADSGEIAKLDSGITRGWARTGQSFPVMSPDTIPSTATLVCRFYGRPSAGLDSHFYSASMAECLRVQQLWPEQWLLETPSTFGIAYKADYGTCGPNTLALYRLYNNRADVNHRYTTSPQIRDTMIAQGWILEGTAVNNTSTDYVAMCLPQ